MTIAIQSSEPQRRWYQYRLLTLLIVLTVFTILLGIGFAAWRSYTAPYRAQREAARRLRRDLGDIEIVWEATGPQWMRDVFGEDEFLEVVEVDLPSASSRPAVTDDHLKELQHFLRLRKLWLYGAEFTDDGLIHLSQLTSLQYLDLTSTPITDEGLIHLQHLTELRGLSLFRTSINGEGFRHLHRLQNLIDLHLELTQFSDENTRHLSRLENLEKLYMVQTPVSDESIPHLRKLSKLKRLDLVWTQVTDEGGDQLKKALPNCKVDHRLNLVRSL